MVDYLGHHYFLVHFRIHHLHGTTSSLHADIAAAFDAATAFDSMCAAMPLLEPSEETGGDSLPQESSFQMKLLHGSALSRICETATKSAVSSAHPPYPSARPAHEPRRHDVRLATLLANLNSFNHHLPITIPSFPCCSPSLTHKPPPACYFSSFLHFRTTHFPSFRPQVLNFAKFGECL